MPIKPIMCRLNMRHVWHTYSNDDGIRYRRCMRCGKDDNRGGGGPADGWAPGFGSA